MSQQLLTDGVLDMGRIRTEFTALISSQVSEIPALVLSRESVETLMSPLLGEGKLVLLWLTGATIA